MMDCQRKKRESGFTLTELAVVLVIVALLVSGLLMPLSAQVDVRSASETEKRMAQIKEALMGFAVANGRLPCPATADSNGRERFTATGDTANGECETFHDGFLPAADLGITPTDEEGFALDGWGASAANRIRYAVYGGQVNGVDHPFTRTDGMKTATMAEIAQKAELLSVCATSTNIQAGTCNTATPLARTAPAVMLALGANAATGGTGNDEAANLDGNRVFVSHTRTGPDAANGEFDDQLDWVSLNVLFNRMISAGRLP